ncbi:LysR family transcriptional regulator [Achromobacter sp. Marseille-Q4962]|uniref:LysR family transcriptional regulator n=1 Tax=Achromobacter sp. Marseille-Q4962 TaxID=2942202 RepID=UPI0020744F14|nr:LysR family transcriptional regulator [Achromobacter sp. Marseille-Q4962]
MKVEAFQTLAAVVAEGSFAAAAHVMHMTPSAVSMQMKQLEQYVGKPLFDRSGQHVRARPAAVELVQTMRPALEALQSLRRRASVVVEGHLRVGVIEALQPMLLPGAMLYLREHYPRLSIAPQRGASMALTEDVKAGRLDAAIVARPQRGVQAGLHWEALASRALVFIGPPRAQDARRRAPTAALSAAELKLRIRAMDWVRYDRGTTTGGLATRYVHRMAPGKRSLVELGSAPAIVAMVSAGLGFSVLQLIDTGLVAQYPVEVRQLPRGGPVFQLGAVTRQADAGDRLQQAWLQAVRHAFARGQAGPALAVPG